MTENGTAPSAFPVVMAQGRHQKQSLCKDIPVSRIDLCPPRSGRSWICRTGGLPWTDIFDYIEVFCNRAATTAIRKASALRSSKRHRREDQNCL